MNRITKYFPHDELFSVGETDQAKLLAFEGREIDSAAELQNNSMRHYDPTPGVWLDESPVGCEADAMNVRRYAP